jgi:hypothetical protein
MKTHEGLSLLSEGRVVWKEPSDMSILSYSENHHGELSTNGSKLLSIGTTPEIALSCIGNEWVELCFRDDPLFNEGIEEKTLQSSVVTLLIGQRNEPLIHHKELNAPQEILWLVR